MLPTLQYPIKMLLTSSWLSARPEHMAWPPVLSGELAPGYDAPWRSGLRVFGSEDVRVSGVRTFGSLVGVQGLMV